MCPSGHSTISDAQAAQLFMWPDPERSYMQSVVAQSSCIMVPRQQLCLPATHRPHCSMTLCRSCARPQAAQQFVEIIYLRKWKVMFSRMQAISGCMHGSVSGCVPCLAYLRWHHGPDHGEVPEYGITCSMVAILSNLWLTCCLFLPPTPRLGGAAPGAHASCACRSWCC